MYIHRCVCVMCVCIWVGGMFEGGGLKQCFTARNLHAIVNIKRASVQWNTRRFTSEGTGNQQSKSLP